MLGQPRSTIDLHSHSTASDGTLSPAALLAAAAAAGVQRLALTDHDTTDGLESAAQAAAAHGIDLVPGVEISVSVERKTLHVLGLGVDPTAPALRQGLDLLQQRRRLRAQAIAGKLERLGVERAFARAEALAAGGQITRSHFARLLVESGLAKSGDRAFKRYLAGGRPAHVASEWAHLPEVIDWIHRAGGVAVLAHPFKYGFGTGVRMRMLRLFRELGGDGVEVCCGSAGTDEIRTGVREAREAGLRGSIGSDFHGPDQPWARLGQVAPLPADIDGIIHARH